MRGTCCAWILWHCAVIAVGSCAGAKAVDWRHVRIVGRHFCYWFVMDSPSNGIFSLGSLGMAKSGRFDFIRKMGRSVISRVRFFVVSAYFNFALFRKRWRLLRKRWYGCLFSPFSFCSFTPPLTLRYFSSCFLFPFAPRCSWQCTRKNSLDMTFAHAKENECLKAHFCFVFCHL